jgi:hypothetical protein
MPVLAVPGDCPPTEQDQASLITGREEERRSLPLLSERGDLPGGVL